MLRVVQVAGRIGKGAYGGVWQATVVNTREEVVLKVVFPDVDLDPAGNTHAVGSVYCS